MMATEEEWAGARARARRVASLMALVGTVVVAALGAPAAYLTNLTASGGARYPVMVGWLALLMAPAVFVMTRRALLEQGKTDAVVAEYG